MEVSRRLELGLAGKKNTVKPGARLAAPKRARAKSAQPKSALPKSVQRPDKPAPRDATQTENARLANELRDALARQTATSEILRVISGSPTDVQPVFDAIVLTATRLFRRELAFILGCDATTYWPVATAGPQGLRTPPDPAPVAIDTDANFPSRVIVTGKNLHLPDWSAIKLPDYERMVHERLGINSALYLPLLREGECIGLLGIAGKRAGIFGNSEIALAESFRDQALIAIENTRSFNETREALERQTATADILKVIASSPSDVQPVFDVIVEHAVRLCGGRMGRVYRYDDGTIHMVAGQGLSGPGLSKVQEVYPRPADDDTTAGQAIQSRRPNFVIDIKTDESVPALSRQMIEALGTRSQVTVPMLRSGEPIGAITVGWAEPGAYGDQQVALLQTFADQAVIAIENVRLFNETREALERQTATADILKVIASSPSDVQPVFEAIASSANRLIGGFSTTVFRFVEGAMHLMAFTPTTAAADEILKAGFPSPVAKFLLPEVVQGQAAQIADTEALPDIRLKETARARGFRSMLFTPLMSGGAAIGIIGVTRLEPGSFAAHHVQLLQTFADQAVIAIENVRLFDEVQARTNDLTESLQQQTATADVLKVISRSAFDLDSVMNTLARSARELSGSDVSTLYLRDGDVLLCRGVAAIEERFAEFQRQNPVPLNAESHMGRAVLTGTIANIADFEKDPNTRLRKFQEVMGFKSFLAVPLMREGRGVGVFILARYQLGAFTQRQVELVQGFADQAVIAIENVRLFDEVQARTRDLTEALTYQTGSGNILKVIASSPTDVEPVLNAIVESACELCEADDAIVHLREGNDLRYAAHRGSMPVGMQRRAISRSFVSGRALVDKVPIHLSDVFSSEGAEFPEAQEMSRRLGIRTLLSVPLLRENESIGTILLRRTEVNPFSDKQIALLQTFADQAVIAIGNVRLFDEVQARTKDLAASLDDLRTAQDRLVQTEKLASLGQLTAGIAHEIKNPLNFVNNFSALSAELTDELLDVLKPAALNDTTRKEVDELTQMLKDNLQKVVQHGSRADSIVKNMLLHSREGSGDHRPADINALLDESLNLAYHGARAEKPQFNVTLQRDFDATAGAIEVFPQEITRVFLNLISNGFYAVTKRKTEDDRPDFEPVLTATTRSLGDTVEIRIRDNGTGIPAEVKEKMFNPFFTTKPAGEGTGLGLSMSHDIVVKQHGGTIEVETEPGQFTEFRIILPRTSHSQEKKRGQS
jgi:two-component system NtrC family sensor kinase